jgi:signal transduction histidine kinase/ActR/RegA family two-component response regulator
MNQMITAQVVWFASTFVLFGAFAYLVWRQQWSWMGLFVAIGCLIACISHVQILSNMLFRPDYASNPIDFVGIFWRHELGWGLLLLVISLTMCAAMAAALRPLRFWSTACICLASSYLLSTTGAWVVQRWISIGELPSLSFGVDWPVWIGFPAFIVMVLGPFAVAIPWSLSRQPKAGGNEANGILTQFRVITGTVAIMLAIVGGSIALGLAQNQWLFDAQTGRLLGIFAIAQALTIVAAAGMAVRFRRSFLAPAISIIEGIRNDKPLADPEEMVAIWRPLARSVEDGRQKAEAYRHELAKSAEALHQSEKLAALGQLLAGVAHELNNPLAAVLGQTALLREDLEGSGHITRIDKINRAAERCSRIVQSFLAMARQKAPDPRPVEMNELVRMAVDLTEYQMRTAGIAVSCDLAHGLPPVMADADQVHQLLVNLLSNARQALEGFDGERRIAIVTRRDPAGNAIELTVSDSGPGVSAEIRNRIFDPFFTTKDEGQGTGFGLAYSLGIAEAHGGSLKLVDTKRGTCFALSLPSTKASRIVPSEKQSPALAGKCRALVIDDEIEVAETLADILERQGFTVSTAIGGAAAIALLEQDAAFDLVLSDLRMPDVDGPALHGWIGENHPQLLPRLGFVTGDTYGDIAGKFLAQCRRPYIEKPFTADSLRTIVAALSEQEPKP